MRSRAAWLPGAESDEFADCCRALRDALWRVAPKVGFDLGYEDGGRSVQHFGEPDSARPNPLWDLYLLMLLLERYQRDEVARYAPLHWLAERCGHRLVQVDAPEAPLDHRSLNAAVTCLSGAFGAVLERVDRALADHRLDRRELEESIVPTVRDLRSRANQLEERLAKVVRNGGSVE